MFLHGIRRLVAIAGTFAVIAALGSTAASAATLPVAGGSLSPSATACLQDAPCSTPMMKASLADLAQNWNSGTDAERQFFATTAPTLFSDQQVIALFSGFNSSGSAAMPAFGEGSSSCYQDGTPISCALQSGSSLPYSLAPATNPLTSASPSFSADELPAPARPFIGPPPLRWTGFG